VENDALSTYLALTVYHKQDQDLLDSLIPLIVLCLKDMPLDYDFYYIKNKLHKRFKLTMPDHALDTVLVRMKKRNLIQSNGVRY
jgi:hypothetical protein